MAVDHVSTVTRGFLFADLRGYTDFVEKHGAAAAAELLTRYRRLAREAVGRFGGAEIKTEGDSFYVVFDSVSGAVRCGLAITGAARAANDEHPEQPIRVGVGVHAGETIEADGGYVGSPVNIAARICAQAGPGEVLVSETVRALTMTLLSVEFRSRGRRQLKGIAEPIELFAVEEAATWPPTRRRRLSRRARAALVAGAVLVLAVAGGVSWPALRPSTGLPAGSWTIGVHVPLSGASASEGIALRNAVQLAVDQTNEAGGIAGVELTVKAYDTTGEDGYEGMKEGAAAAREMAGDPRTIATVGPLSSYVARGTIPITNRAGLLECSPSNSDPSLTSPEHGALELRAEQPKRINYVRLSPSADILSRALAAYATHDLDAGSALVIAHPDWRFLATDFTEAFTALGGQVAHAELTDGMSPTAALEPIQDGESSPDVVVFAGSTIEGAAQVRQAMHEAGLDSTPFVSWDTILEDSYLQQAGDAADGTYVGHTAIAPPRADFVDAYRAAFGEEPTEYAGAAYACAQVILASLEAVAGDGPAAGELREALRAYAVDPAHRYETAIGTVGFDANGDSMQQMVSMYRVDLQAAGGAGDWVLVKQQDFGPP